MSRSQDLITNLLAFADIRVNGSRLWDIQVHDKRFFFRVMAVGTLGFGESYMDGWLGVRDAGRARPQFADRYAERFRRMWRFYLLSCAGAFRAGSLQVFLFSF